MFRFKNKNIHIFIVDPFVYHVIVQLKGVEILSELIESWDQERNFIDSGAKVKINKYYFLLILILLLNNLFPDKRSSERLALALQRQRGCLNMNIYFMFIKNI